MICKILGPLVNALTVGDKYSLLNGDILKPPIQMQLSQKENFFSQFLSAFLKSRSNLEHFQEKMTLTPDAFLKLRTPKNMVR